MAAFLRRNPYRGGKKAGVLLERLSAAVSADSLFPIISLVLAEPHSPSAWIGERRRRRQLTFSLPIGAGGIGPA